MYPTISNLDHVVTQLVQFASNDFESFSEEVPNDVLLNIAYTASCFLHQHTNDTAGVDPDTALSGLKIGEAMSYDQRLALVREMIAELGGEIK